MIDVEHVLSWAITIGLHRAVPPVPNVAGLAPVLLACTAGEGHVLPLEVLRAALGENAIPALLLGSAVPGNALADSVAKQSRSPVVVLWSQTNRTAIAEALPAGSGPARLLQAGPGWSATSVLPGGWRVGTLEEAVAEVSRLARTGE